MSAINYKNRFPRFYFLLMLALFLLIMTALKSAAQCDSTKVCTSKSVLKYLYIQNEKAGFLAKDTFNLGQILSKQNQQLVLKDSLISNRNKALVICESEKSIKEIQINSYKIENKKLSNKVTLFKITTLIAIVTTILALFH